MARQKTDWGKPGETGVNRDGIPWYVPEEGPGRGTRFLYWLFPTPVRGSMPPGAKFLKASTAAEVQERTMRKHGDTILKLLNDNEELQGFAEFGVTDKVPQPPRGGIEAKVGPSRLKRWWMGGDWNTIAGQLNITLGNSRYRDFDSSGVHTRDRLLIRTSRRVMIWAGDMATPLTMQAEFALNQIGLRPGWRAGDPANEGNCRVDIAFIDGSWIGVEGGTHPNIPGGSSNGAATDLLASLVGPPVTAEALPALGRG